MSDVEREAYVDKITDWSAENAELEKALIPVWRVAYDAGAEQMEQLYKLQAVQRPELVALAKLNGGDRVVGITDTIKKDISNAITTGIKPATGCLNPGKHFENL